MKVLVCGGRDFGDVELVHRTLDGLHGETPITVVIEGGARGADKIAFGWASLRKVGSDTHPANWDAYGPRAGPIRNQQMLDNAKPDLVVAFPGGRGTADMVRRSKAAGVRVIEVSPFTSDPRGGK